MLVTFKTSAHGDITMFGSAAEDLLKMMGQSGNVPGAIMAPDVPGALNELKTRLAAEPGTDTVVPSAELKSGPGLDSAADAGQGHPNVDESDEVRPVSLSARATPLIGLLEAAAAGEANVIWEE